MSSGSNPFDIFSVATPTETSHRNITNGMNMTGVHVGSTAAPSSAGNTAPTQYNYSQHHEAQYYSNVPSLSVTANPYHHPPNQWSTSTAPLPFPQQPPYQQQFAANNYTYSQLQTNSANPFGSLASQPTMTPALTEANHGNALVAVPTQGNPSYYIPPNQPYFGDTMNTYSSQRQVTWPPTYPNGQNAIEMSNPSPLAYQSINPGGPLPNGPPRVLESSFPNHTSAHSLTVNETTNNNAPTVANDDVDFFGIFSAKPPMPPITQSHSTEHKQRQTEPTPVHARRTDNNNDSLPTVKSGSFRSTESRGSSNAVSFRSVGSSLKDSSTSPRSAAYSSPLDDPDFAPPPDVKGLRNAQILAQNAPPLAGPLPVYDKITHSGDILARISMRSIFFKDWKPVFWITYDKMLLFFRSYEDFEDWVSNPYLTITERDFLIKFKVDFEEEPNERNGFRGHAVTPLKMKNYGKELLHHFKLERHMDYGPTIAACFASHSRGDTENLLTIFSEMMKRVQPKHTQRKPNVSYGFDQRASYDYTAR